MRSCRSGWSGSPPCRETSFVCPRRRTSSYMLSGMRGLATSALFGCLGCVGCDTVFGIEMTRLADAPSVDPSCQHDASDGGLSYAALSTGTYRVSGDQVSYKTAEARCEADAMPGGGLFTHLVV